jgi:regulator of protease activity HflC (stomatin/prohibitin superfamily)
MKEQVADFEPQSVITKDNVTMNVDSVVYFQVINPEALTYGVERPIAAIENLCATTLRNIIGSMTLDETLTSREKINNETIKVLDEATNKWGIDITRVEVQNITPPKSIQEAMEKQMKAEREKRAVILTAEGEKQSAITRAEGEKESAILRAEAVREERIRTAEGEAEAIRAVAEAQAKAIEMVNNAKPSKEYLSIRSMEAAEKMADGQSTKIIVPSELQNLVTLGEVFKETK